MSAKGCISFHLLYFFSCTVLFFLSVFFSVVKCNINKDTVEPVKKETSESCAPKDHIALFNAATQENFELKFTGHSLEVIGDPFTTVGSTTGGSVGNAVYKFYKIAYYWNTCDNKIIFETNVIYYNTEYGTFENALKHHGVLLVAIPVEADGCIDNPAFEEFEKTMHEIKKPGDCTSIHSTASYVWFKNFPSDIKYTSFIGSLYDENTGKHWKGLKIYKSPWEPKANYLSREQFARTFELLTDKLGNKVNIFPPVIKADTPVVTRKGIKVNLVPG